MSKADPGALPSIRQRLARVLVGVSLAWGLAVSAVVWLSVRHEVDELLDDTLQQSAAIILALLQRHPPPALPADGRVVAEGADDPLVWQVVDAQGVLHLRSPTAPPSPLLAAPKEGLAHTADGGWRVYTLPFGSEGRLLLVAQRGSERSEARIEVATVTAAGALVVGLLCAIWLRLQVRRELLPIEALSNAVAQHDPLQPAAPLAAATRAELAPLRDAVEELGERLAKRLASERAFSAHAAHALRTPLAGLVAQLAVAQRRAPPDTQPALQRARSAADRLRRVVGALLALFRSGAELQRQPVDLAELLSHLPFETLALRADAPAPVQADPDLLAGALLNLLDNAARHGASEVAVAAAGDAIELHDNGRGIAEADRARLQAALDAQDYERHVGLGLMLADLVARAHGGRLRLLPAEAGCRVQLSLAPAGDQAAFQKM